MIGAAQLRCTTDVDENFANVELIAKDAKNKGVKLLCLPECFAFIGGDNVKVAESLETGSLIKKYKDLAKSLDIWLSLGGFPEISSVNPGKKIHNSHIIVDNTGQIKAVYRKIHLFFVDIPNTPKLDESEFCDGGKDIVVVDSPVGKLGLTTCYDLRFPEQYIALRKAGAEIFLAPSAFTLMTGKDHWEPLIRARAIENQCYVVAAAQWGVHNEKRTSYGRTCIVDPWGTLVACSSDKAPSLVLHEIDLDYLAKVRKNMPVWSHRKQECYRSVEYLSLIHI
eukprot:TRINITY_DN2154_c0_g1_i2.p1 TRINITY_DN2154_c0_g1~~TRINITY_DN2154_c0_g1_i2.p1  ORF type:complete len:281 (-),score=49.63 TRINITY_DN2154_c0_g1_i2:25-867(-)